MGNGPDRGGSLPWMCAMFIASLTRSQPHARTTAHGSFDCCSVRPLVGAGLFELLSRDWVTGHWLLVHWPLLTSGKLPVASSQSRRFQLRSRRPRWVEKPSEIKVQTVSSARHRQPTESYCTFVIAGGTHWPSRAWGFGAYRRMVTPRGPLAGDGSQLDSLSLPGDSC